MLDATSPTIAAEARLTATVPRYVSKMLDCDLQTLQASGLLSSIRRTGVPHSLQLHQLSFFMSISKLRETALLTN